MDPRDAFRRAEQRAFAQQSVAFQAHCLELAEPSLRARVLECGTGDALLLVHGGGGFGSQWLPLMAQLPNWRCLAVDRPGCGLSQAFDYRGTDLRKHAVSFLESTLDALELERVPLVANSMGGLWSLWFAVDRPERVSSLALLGCPALFPGTGAPVALRLMSVGPLLRVLTKLPSPKTRDFARGLSKLLGSDAVAAMSEPELECMRLAQRIPGASTSFTTLLERVLTPWRVRPGAGVGNEELQRIRSPTLLIWGRDDLFGDPETAARGAAQMPHATLRLVEGGHQPWSSQPELCARLYLEFLGTLG